MSRSPWVISSPFKVIVAVASLGGLEAVTELLAAIPQTFRVPLLVVQHRQARSGADRLAEVLQNHCRLPVVIASDRMLLSRHVVAVVPGGFTATLDSDHRITLTEGADNHSGDATLGSVARVFGSSAIAVILSGTLDDGTAGVREIKRHGGRVLVQNPATARAAAMPNGAIATGCIDYVLEPRRIASALVALTMAPGGADLLAVPSAHWANREA